jgi:hypothetical protein
MIIWLPAMYANPDWVTRSKRRYAAWQRWYGAMSRDACSISVVAPNPTRMFFLLYEQYETHAALAAHRETPHFQAIIEREIVPMLEQREREFYSLVA